MGMDLQNSHRTGPPIALQRMLYHVLGISDLKTWSIYQFKERLVTLNTRSGWQKFINFHKNRL